MRCAIWYHLHNLKNMKSTHVGVLMLHFQSCNITSVENKIMQMTLENSYISFTANPVGTACLKDFDADGVEDHHDNCPYVSNIHTTSFEDYFLVDLSQAGINATTPKWRQSNKVRRSVKKVMQQKNDLKSYKIDPFVSIVSNLCYCLEVFDTLPG